VTQVASWDAEEPAPNPVERSDGPRRVAKRATSMPASDPPPEPPQPQQPEQKKGWFGRVLEAFK
jgi:hypothetical protein